MSTTGGSTTSGAPTPPQTEVVANSGYGSGDETTSLLTREPPVTITPAIAPASSKPVLMRQECTTLLLSSPGHLGGSQESGTGVCLMEESSGAARSVPDIELHCRLQGESSVAVTMTSPAGSHQGFTSTSTTAGTCRLRTASAGYHLLPHAHSRCRCGERRDSHSTLILQPLARSVSRESVRSVGLHHQHHCPCNTAPCSGGSCPAPPPAVLLTTSPYSSRIIRQSSQPEASAPALCTGQCMHHLHGSAPTQPSVSLRQLREPGDGIAGIAADSLRINGAIRQFKQPVEISYCQVFGDSLSSALKMATELVVAESLTIRILNRLETRETISNIRRETFKSFMM